MLVAAGMEITPLYEPIWFKRRLRQEYQACLHHGFGRSLEIESQFMPMQGQSWGSNRNGPAASGAALLWIEIQTVGRAQPGSGSQRPACCRLLYTSPGQYQISARTAAQTNQTSDDCGDYRYHGNSWQIVATQRVILPHLLVHSASPGRAQQAEDLTVLCSHGLMNFGWTSDELRAQQTNLTNVFDNLCTCLWCCNKKCPSLEKLCYVSWAQENKHFRQEVFAQLSKKNCIKVLHTSLSDKTWQDPHVQTRFQAWDSVS